MKGQTITHAKKCEHSQEKRWGKKMGDTRALWWWDKLIHLQRKNTRKYLNFFFIGCDTNLAYKNVRNYIEAVEIHTLATIIWLDVVLLDLDHVHRWRNCYRSLQHIQQSKKLKDMFKALACFLQTLYLWKHNIVLPNKTLMCLWGTILCSCKLQT